MFDSCRLFSPSKGPLNKLLPFSLLIGSQPVNNFLYRNRSILLSNKWEVGRGGIGEGRDEGVGERGKTKLCTMFISLK